MMRVDAISSTVAFLREATVGNTENFLISGKFPLAKIVNKEINYD